VSDFASVSQRARDSTLPRPRLPPRVNPGPDPNQRRAPGAALPCGHDARDQRVGRGFSVRASPRAANRQNAWARDRARGNRPLATIGDPSSLILANLSVLHETACGLAKAFYQIEGRVVVFTTGQTLPYLPDYMRALGGYPLRRLAT
jgi:hypothetical protein